MKAHSPTGDMELEMGGWSTGEVGGIRSVAVKCVDIKKNSGGEGSLLNRN